MSPDWAAEGLLDGVEGEEAREARRALLQELHEDGTQIDELREAIAEDRLALLPVERVLAARGDRFTAAEVAERAGIDRDFVLRLRQALGLTRPEPEDRVFTQEDIDAARRAQRFTELGIPEESRLEVSRVMGRALAEIAAAMRESVAEAFLEPGSTERELGLRYAEAARRLVPEIGPTLQYILGVHLREQVRQEVVAQAELSTGRLPGTRTITVCFADLVDFTRLGEELSPEDLGAVARRLTELAGEVASPPVRLVKMIGDASMLVGPETEGVVEVALGLLAAAEAEGEDFPALRAGVACGPAVGRGGDWYGAPVNLASRITAVARPNSLLVTNAVADALSDGYRLSRAGRRSFKGVRGEVGLMRVRRAEAAGAAEDVG